MVVLEEVVTVVMVIVVIAVACVIEVIVLVVAAVVVAVAGMGIVERHIKHSDNRLLKCEQDCEVNLPKFKVGFTVSCCQN